MIKNVVVTETHIKDGVGAICFLCPIALAIRTLVKTSVHVQVTQNYVRFSVKGDYKTTLLPDVAKDFIRMFDLNLWHGGSIQFPLSIPEEYLI